MLHRANMNKEWLGLSGDKLVAITGWEDVIYCHDKGFMLIAGSVGTLKKAADKVLEKYN